MKPGLEITVAIVTLVVIIIGGYMFIENRYALRNQLQKIEIRLDMKIIRDDRSQTQDRIWDLEDRIKENPEDITAIEELRKLKEDKKDYVDKLNTLRQSIMTID